MASDFAKESLSQRGEAGKSEFEARTVSSEVVSQQLLSEFAGQINTGVFSKNQVESFARDSITAITLNGTNVLCVDFEHTDNEINPITIALINSVKTRAIIPEYFYPELELNAKKAGLFSKMENAKEDFGDRIKYARKIADICKESGKPIGVVDIANKINYQVSRSFFRDGMTLLAGLGTAGASGVFTKTTPDLLTTFSLLTLAGANMVRTANLDRSRKKEEGIFDKERIGKLDRYILDFEQARRFYASMGIEQLTKEYRSTVKVGGNEPRIVVLYPKAHGIRIADNLLNPNHGLDQAKNIIYKLFGPGLDFSVRQWQWKKVFQDESDNSSGYWDKFSDRKIQF